MRDRCGRRPMRDPNMTVSFGFIMKLLVAHVALNSLLARSLLASVTRVPHEILRIVQPRVARLAPEVAVLCATHDATTAHLDDIIFVVVRAFPFFTGVSLMLLQILLRHEELHDIPLTAEFAWNSFVGFVSHDEFLVGVELAILSQMSADVCFYRKF